MAESKEVRFMKFNHKVLSLGGGGDSKIKVDTAITACAKASRGFAEGATVLSPGNYSAAQLLAIIKQEFPTIAPVTKYTISATVDPTGAGNVTGTGQYEKGTTCTLTASPVGNYVFKYWDADTTKTQNPLTFTVTGNESHVAKFEATPTPVTTYTVTATAGANGTVSPTSKTVNEGATATFTATPATGYKVASWKFNGVAQSETGNTFTTPAITADSTVEVEFAFIPVPTILVRAVASPTEGGTATIDGGASAMVEVGSTANLVATPNTGYKFVQWDDGDTNATRTITVVESKDVYTATFEPTTTKKLGQYFLLDGEDERVQAPTLATMTQCPDKPPVEITDAQIAEYKANGMTLVFAEGYSEDYNYEPIFTIPATMGAPAKITQSGLQVSWGQTNLTIDGVECLAIYVKTFTDGATYVITW